MERNKTEEFERLEGYHKRSSNWKLWGPYLSERAWGTVREDYSAEGEAWEYFPHEHARSRVYRWNEDGLLGISDRNQYLCFALALWNGKDEILKERFFGLSGKQGNHGEDVKEYYFYLDSSPTHSYMKALYKYPQNRFPYQELVHENSKRTRDDFEYELLDTGIFNDDRYFDVFIEYAKNSESDILIRIEIFNRGPELAEIHLLPQLWFRNTWSWGYDHGPMDDVREKPILKQISKEHGKIGVVEANHSAAGTYFLYAADSPELLFTENETNAEKIFGKPNASRYVKDAFHRYLIESDKAAINPDKTGTKAAILYKKKIPPGKSAVFRLRLTKDTLEEPFSEFNAVFEKRKLECDAYYNSIQPKNLPKDLKQIQRRAFGSLLWSKQLYYYDIEQWLRGDKNSPRIERKNERNAQWEHLTNFDPISMPDKWEYPWYASWDAAFHCLPLALVDPDFAKRQLTLFTREWYAHPNGQLPAYEWNFNDVNPPVHAWAAWRVYKIDEKHHGKADRQFLEGIFHKLLLNFTWWVNRKDSEGMNVFQGGFLGMDNISIIDRSAPLPLGGHIDQSDGTAWMGFYSAIMLRIALELAKDEPVYQDIATKFFEHFMRIATAMANRGGKGMGLWNHQDGFFYDILNAQSYGMVPLRVRSLVGLLPLFAVETIDDEIIKHVPIFQQRLKWFISKRPQYTSTMMCIETPGNYARRIISLITKEQLIRILGYMLDENEFLSDYGIRSLSKYHQTHPYSVNIEGKNYVIGYEPAEARTDLFGGNSNWRGPIWFPINYLIIESLQKYHHYYGDEFKVEFPTNSGKMLNLKEVADELSKRLINIFRRDQNGHMPLYGGTEKFQKDPLWRDYLLFYEYFHGDNGAGLGASHQTGWTSLVAKLIQQCGDTS